MLNELLERSFLAVGARVKFAEVLPPRRGTAVIGELTLDVERDARGEYFMIRRRLGSSAELTVLDVEPKDSHLVLLSRTGKEKHRFLLGHDERHWFVAAIPESRPITRVRDAKHALKPEAVLAREVGLSSRDRERRINARYIRQGEWFFVPVIAIAGRVCPGSA